MRRIAWFATARSVFLGQFHIAMSALGHELARSYSLEEHFSADEARRIAEITRELKTRPPDVIVVVGGANLRAVAAEIRSVPIIAIAGDLVGQGMAQSLSRPGGNVTGISLSFADIALKWLELTKEAIPSLRRVLVVADRVAAPYATQIDRAARTFGVAVLRALIEKPVQIEPAFSSGREAGAEAAIVPASSFFAAHRQQFIEAERKYRLPTMYEHRGYVDAGGLMSYGPDLREAHGRAAYYVDRIFKGAEPRDVPIEQPAKFELVLNLKTAKAMNFTFPPAILVRADEVIE